MKKSRIYLVFTILVLFLMSSCVKDDSPVITQGFEMDTFTGIKLSIAGNIKIIEGDEQSVQITGPEVTVGKIVKSVSSGTWDIHLPSSYHKSYDDLEIVITSNDIAKLIISGAGDISAEHTLPISEIAISGAGNINVVTEVTALNSRVSGSGNISISGKVTSLIHKVSGYGKFDGFDLETTDAEISISGSGDTEVSVTNSLKVKISGAGDVYYKGTPSITQSVSGWGSITNAN